MMIDCGFSVNTKDEYKYSTIYTYLTETAGLQKGGKIDYIVNTHSDGDHYNGFVSLLRDFEIGEIWLPWVWTDGSDELNSPTYEDNSGFTTFIKKSIEEVGLAKVHAIKADELEDITNDGTFGDNDYDYRVRFISPTKQFINNHIDTPAKPDLYNNTVSAMMTLEFGNQIFVFTGDAEGIESGVADRKTEGEFISVVSQQYPTLFTSGKHVYLKVAHHGAKTKGSNSLEFLNFIKPEFAFISAGRDYNDAHPDPSVAERLADFCGENVYVTKDIGNITAAFDGNNIEINGVIKKADPIKTISVSGAFIIAGIFVVIICFYKFNDGKTVSKKSKK
jgi:beta-lactamase superfamily II metal-dependent hydrolase